MPPTILLVHGAWHGAWCWSRVEAQLAAHGIASRTVDLPSCGADAAALGGLDDDIATVSDAIAAIDGDTIVCGHSYGGVVITGAATAPTVVGLVYLCAFMPDRGESLVSLLPPGPLPPFVTPVDQGALAFRRELARDLLFPDCDEATAADATDRLVLHSGRATATPVSDAAWRTVPATYVVALDDAVIPAQAQRAMAVRAATVVEVAASHSPELSRPSDVADAISAVAVSAAT